MQPVSAGSLKSGKLTHFGGGACYPKNIIGLGDPRSGGDAGFLLRDTDQDGVYFP
jgi:hypothetical protein